MGNRNIEEMRALTCLDGNIRVGKCPHSLRLTTQGCRTQGCPCPCLYR